MDPNQIRFRAGEMQSFMSTRSFSLGSTGVQIPRNSEILFDGATVEYAGQQYSFPQLRGAIRTEWVVPTRAFDENDPNYGRPVSANVQVRHATKGGNPMEPGQRMAIPTTQSDERMVGTVKAHADRTKQANQNYQPGQRVNTTMGTIEIEPQDGVPVRALKTDNTGDKSKYQRTKLTAETVGTALRNATNTPPIEAGQGADLQDHLDRMNPQEREAYMAELELHKSSHVDEPMAARQVISADANPGRRIIGRVETQRTANSDGFQVRNDVGHGTEIADLAGVGGGAKPKESVIYEDGMTFRTTNGPDRSHAVVQAHPRSAEAQQRQAAPAPAPRPVMPEQSAEIRKKIAKAVCSDFPDNYDFTMPVKKRMARLQADYEDRPDVIQAVFAAEGDEVKTLLMQEFPQAFTG